MNDVRERVIRAIGAVLKLDENEIENLRNDVGYKMIAKWTSARHAEIIVAIEDEFGIEIEERAIPKLNNVAKFVEHVKTARP